MASPSRTPRASELSERFIKQLNVAFKAVRLYPPSSAIPKESATTALTTLRMMLRESPDVSFVVTKEGLFHEDGLVFPDQPAFVEFAKEFFTRRLAEFRFHTGVTVPEMIEFLRVLDVPRAEFARTGGGFEARLWDGSVVNITVKEATTRVIDHTEIPMHEDDQEEEGWPPEAMAIDEVLAQASAGHPRDHIVLVRVLDSPEVLSAYLRESSKGRGSTPSATWVTSRVSQLSSSAVALGGAEAKARLHDIAEALMSLPDDGLRDVLTEKLLSEARKDDSLAEVVRSIGLDRICSVLAAGVEDTEDSRNGLSRALRNLVNIAGVDREGVMGAAAHAMENVGLSGEAADAVLGSAMPKQITVRERRQAEDSPLAKIIRLADMGVGANELVEDPETARLTAEAREGITDGDVLTALVTLASIERRDEKFGSLMAVIEDSLGLLVLRQEYEVAATIVEALSETAEDLSRSEDQRARIAAALEVLSSKGTMRQVAGAMRRFDLGTPEHRACRHLLTVLGRFAIAPLLEVLADEPDMTARKSMVALISEIAIDHMDELGDRLSDRRWYFVRNIVTIIGSTRTSQTSSLLERTLRHDDARVRRETIRAAAAISDAFGIEMLVAALSDMDSQNVQLAARYLGLKGGRSGIPVLEEVASGQGRGSRETPTRIEAIEALGRLRSAGSLPLLRDLTRTRGIRGRARNREMASAAKAAIDVISGASGPAPGGDA